MHLMTRLVALSSIYQEFSVLTANSENILLFTKISNLFYLIN